MFVFLQQNIQLSNRSFLISAHSRPAQVMFFRELFPGEMSLENIEHEI